MTTFITKHSTSILMSLLLMLLILAWIFPAIGLKLGIAFLLLSFLIASLAVLEKHRKAYGRKELTRGVFIRNSVLEVGGTFLVMLLAALMARYAAEIATRQIGDDLTRVVAGIIVGLLVGITVGVLGKKTLRRWVDVTPRG